MRGDHLRIAVQAPPVDGKGNDALVAFVSDLVGLPRRAETVVAGQPSPDKRLAIDAPFATVAAVIGAAGAHVRRHSWRPRGLLVCAA